MALLKYNTEAIHTASLQLQSGATQMTGEISRLSNLVVSLGESWQGPSKSSFDAAHAQWHAASQKMMQALEDLSRVAKIAAMNADAADKASMVK